MHGTWPASGAICGVVQIGGQLGMEFGRRPSSNVSIADSMWLFGECMDGRLGHTAIGKYRMRMCVIIHGVCVCLICMSCVGCLLFLDVASSDCRENLLGCPSHKGMHGMMAIHV